MTNSSLTFLINTILRLRALSVTIIVVATAIVAFGAEPESIESLLQRLDAAIASEDNFVRAKLQRISDIKAQRKKIYTQEERYWNNRMLYDEYFVFNADSALRYAVDNIDIARATGNRQWEYEWMINKSFALSVMGFLNEAKDELSQIPVDALSDANKIKYYGQLAYLYSHMGQLSDHRIIENEDYDHISHVYEDSIMSIIAPKHAEYLWYQASSKIDNENLPNDLLQKVKTAVDTCSFNSRTDAMNSYILSRIYERLGDRENHMRYLILSGITDVSIANRDIASLNELANILLDEGDIERAYAYVNYSQNQALKLPNRIRAVSLAKTVAQVHKLHEERLRASQQHLTTAMIVVVVIMLLLVVGIIMYNHRSRQLKKSQAELHKINRELTQNMEELSRSKSERDELIADLQQANKHNRDISQRLREANYVKEECIGATFALCSSYIDRFEKYRKDLLKLVKNQKWKELQEEVIVTSYVNRELKDFYRSFDSLFLNIYPDFVRDFNSLLRPEEQLTVNPGELNTELRIYALVRLGISDSVKIAALLHCSTQTVYNYRLRMRNKAIIDKQNFAEAVKSLGKHQQ